MRHAVTLAVTLWLAAACMTYRGSPAQWTKPGLDPVQLAADEYVCDRDAERFDATPTIWPGGLIDGAGILAEDLRSSLPYRM